MKILRLLTKLFRRGLTSQDQLTLVRFLKKTCDHLLVSVSARRYARVIYHKVFLQGMRLAYNTFWPQRPFQAPTVRPIARQKGVPDYIIFGVIDWHFRHQRPQQLALALVKMGRRVFYISPNMIYDKRAGFKAEALDSTGLLFQIQLFVQGKPEFYYSAPTAAMCAQLELSMGEVLLWADCQYSIALTQHPFWTEVSSKLPNSRLAYDCMDDHHAFNPDGRLSPSLVGLERSLIQHAELVITTSIALEDKFASPEKCCALIRNAADYDYFSKVPANIYQDPKGRRIIGYYGAVAEWFDIDLLESLAREYSDCCILLIGRDTVNAQLRFKTYSNVVLIGEVPYQNLSYYLHAFDVCILPFKINPLTLATNPVKVYEYLSAGKPVVSVNLPEMEQFAGLVYVTVNQHQFSEVVGRVLQQPESEVLIESRKHFASGQTWKHRAESLIQEAESTVYDPMVSVIVVTYNNLQLTQDCLASLEEHSQYANLEIIVVDNASSDGSLAFLREWVLKDARYRFILNNDNLGFAAANNQGLALAKGDYLVLLNNDTYVTPGWIRTLYRHLQEDKTIGLIGPVTNNIGNEAKIEISFGDRSDMLVKAAFYTSRNMGKRYPLRTAAFFCVMMRRDVYERVGPLDEAFGRGFFEDDDYCRRVEQLGLRIVCAEDVFIYHHLSASFNQLKRAERQALFDQNKSIYEAKWGKWIPHCQRTTIPVPEIFRGSHWIKGECVVCGKRTRFFYREIALWRESLTCEHCRTTSRYRSIARGILMAIHELTGKEGSTSKSLETLARLSDKKLSIYDTQSSFYYDTCAYPLPDLLKAKNWINVVSSQYKSDQPLGIVLAEGVLNQNLECLTFADSSLDIVITSDVMEHVRLDDRAHREIYRVMKPGGLYVFTVPHVQTWENTLLRVQIIDPEDASKDLQLLEPEYHGDVNNVDGKGVLAYRTYGRDLEMFLKQLGFEVQYFKENLEELGILSTELFYCRKSLHA